MQKSHHKPKNRLLGLVLLFTISLSEVLFGQRSSLSITEAPRLKKIQMSGYSFDRALSTADFKSPAKDIYQDIVGTIKNKIRYHRYQNENLRPHHEFKAVWLRSALNDFSLTGIVYRPDLRWKQKSPCGEMRFLFRPKRAEEFLPASFMLIYNIKKNKSKKCSKSFTSIIIENQMNANYQDFISQNLILDRLEINLLAFVWKATKEKTFTPQNHYLLLELQKNNLGFAVKKLTNQPDTIKIRADKELKTSFVKWLNNDHVQKQIKSGTVTMPDKYLAESAMAITPFSLSRLASHPLNSTLKPDDLIVDKTLFESSSHLMDRVNSLSCSGCHGRHSVAGFHVIGSNPTEEFPRFSINSPTSPGFKIREKFRHADFNQWSSGSNHKVEYPDFIQRNEGKFGDICTTTSQFPGNNCQAGLACNPNYIGSKHIGVGYCLPEKLNYNAAPCDSGSIYDAFIDPTKAIFKSAALDFCGPKSICAPTTAGFPGGQCATACSNDDSDDPCIATPLLGPFSECVTRTNDIRDCARKHNTSVKMRPCSSHSDCRIEYACVDYNKDTSFCAPPYVLPGLNLERK